MTYLNLYLISVIWVLILDLSGFMSVFKRSLARFLHLGPNFSENISLKPFDCSFCMTWWSGLIYLIVIHKISFLTISITLLFSFLTTTTKDLIFLIQDFLSWIIKNISKHLL